MSSFNTFFDEVFADHVKPNMVLARVLLRKFIKSGHVPEDKAPNALNDIFNQLEGLKESGDIFDLWEREGLSVKLDDDVLSAEYVGKDIDIGFQITEEDLTLEQTKFIEFVERSTDKIMNFISEKLTESWREAAKNELDRIREESSEFASVVYEAWGTALDLLAVLIDLCVHHGSKINDEFADVAARRGNFKFDALRRIHARSCQVATEIYTLLREGLADGANARWRALHELTVISDFLSKHDQITAKRFLLHSQIEEYKLMETYQQAAKRLGWTPVSPKTLTNQKQIVDRLRSKYGNAFLKDYGWAAHIIKKPKQEKVTFADIEALADRDNFIFAVKMAHKHVHASAYGTLHPLGASPTDDFLIAGGSIYGLDEPGKQAAQALCVVTANLLLSRNDLEDLVTMNALVPIRDDLWAAFNDSEAKVREQAEKTLEAKKKTRKYRIIPNIILKT